jgi:periplasmic protein TonB
MRIYTLVCSILAHAIAVSVVVIAPLFATSDLPEPRRTSTSIVIRSITVPDVRRQAARAARDPSPARVPPVSPPTVAPEAIADVPNDVPIEVGISPIPAGSFVSESGLTEPLPAPAPARTPPPPLRVGGSIRPPAKVAHVSPVYPAIARAAQVEGTVILEAVISESGGVDAVRVLRSAPLLDAAAIEAVRQWRFTPTMLNGQPIPVVMTVTVTFTLGR